MGNSTPASNVQGRLPLSHTTVLLLTFGNTPCSLRVLTGPCGSLFCVASSTDNQDWNAYLHIGILAFGNDDENLALHFGPIEL